VLGVRGSYASGLPGGDSLGLGVGAMTAYGLDVPPLTIRISSLSAIGGGSYGTEGIYEPDFAFGLALPLGGSGIGDWHGPFARIGARGLLLGNSQLWVSFIDAPQGQLGYHFERRRFMFELAARGAATLDGRYDVGDGSRHLGLAFGHGGYAALGLSSFYAQAEITRVVPPDAFGGAFVMSVGRLCYAPGGFAVCADARWMSGSVISAAAPNGQEQQVAFGGLTVGFGI